MEVPIVFYLLLNILSLTIGDKPNIVFILTDDQDVILEGMQTLTKTKELIVNKGLTFNNAFVTSPICCISRSSIVTGRYMHNTQVYNNSLDGGCSNTTWQSEFEPYTYATSARDAGYQTFYAGKYLNQYGEKGAGGTEHIPQGWTQWYGLVGNSKYYDYCVSDQGNQVCKNKTYNTDYFTDVIKRQALAWLSNITKNEQDNNLISTPLLMVLATPAAHAPFTPAPQYMNASAGENSPRTPNWNVTGSKVSTKHELIRQTPALTTKTADQSDTIFRYRHGTLQSVDDMVAAVYQKLSDIGRLNNTYFIYTSDHGFHLGQWGMGFDKRQLYESDIRIPFYISGPGIPSGVSTDIVALNIDIAPTIAELTSENVPEEMDGRSLKKYLFDSTYHINNNNTNKIKLNYKNNIKQQFMVEYSGEGKNVIRCGSGIANFSGSTCDSWNNTYQCVRTIDGTIGQVNGTIYCRFICYDDGHDVIPCETNTPESQGEYYNMDDDPWQLTNLWTTLDTNIVTTFDTLVSTFLNCGGQTECNAMRE